MTGLDISRFLRLFVMILVIAQLVITAFSGNWVKILAIGIIAQILNDVWWDLIEKPIEEGMYDEEEEPCAR